MLIGDDIGELDAIVGKLHAIACGTAIRRGADVDRSAGALPRPDQVRDVLRYGESGTRRDNGEGKNNGAAGAHESFSFFDFRQASCLTPALQIQVRLITQSTYS